MTKAQKTQEVSDILEQINTLLQELVELKVPEEIKNQTSIKLLNSIRLLNSKNDLRMSDLQNILNKLLNFNV